MRAKLEEMSDCIKEKLKDAYSVVRDTHAKINSKIADVKSLTDQIKSLRFQLESLSVQTPPLDLPFNEFDQHNEEDNDACKDLSETRETLAFRIKAKISHAQTRLKQINDELKYICELNSTNNAFNEAFITLGNHSCNLYPKFNIYVDTSKLINDIKELSLRIAPNDVLSPKVIVSEDVNLNVDLHNLCKSDKCLDCEVKSGITNDGIFWLQLISCDDVHFRATTVVHSHQFDDNNRLHNNKQKLNLFIEEINKYVRRKRIGDTQWLTYAELEREPVLDEKCFCLEPSTRKWVRARITSIDADKKQFQVRLMDTGHLLTTFFTLDNLIEWKNFDLSKIAARSIRCVLFNEKSDDKYEKDIRLETRFKFKDSTVNIDLKCVLVQPLHKIENDLHSADVYNDENDNQIWLVKLYKQEDVKEKLDVNNNQNNLENVKETQSETQCLNDYFIEFNNKEKNPNCDNVIDKEMRCVDIRVAEGKFVSKKVMIKTKIESNEEISISGNSKIYFCAKFLEKVVTLLVLNRNVATFFYTRRLWRLRQYFTLKSSKTKISRLMSILFAQFTYSRKNPLTGASLFFANIEFSVIY